MLEEILHVTRSYVKHMICYMLIYAKTEVIGYYSKGTR